MAKGQRSYYESLLNKLTPQHRAFVLAYNGNARQAAIAAGYKVHTTDKNAAERILAREDVIKAIRAREADQNAALIATSEELQMFWTSIMRGNAVAVEVRNEAGEIQPAVAYPTIDQRIKASEALAKAKGMFITKIRDDTPRHDDFVTTLCREVGAQRKRPEGDDDWLQ